MWFCEKILCFIFLRYSFEYFESIIICLIGNCWLDIIVVWMYEVVLGVIDDVYGGVYIKYVVIKRLCICFSWCICERYYSFYVGGYSWKVVVVVIVYIIIFLG